MSTSKGFKELEPGKNYWVGIKLDDPYRHVLDMSYNSCTPVDESPGWLNYCFVRLPTEDDDINSLSFVVSESRGKEKILYVMKRTFTATEKTGLSEFSQLFQNKQELDEMHLCITDTEQDNYQVESDRLDLLASQPYVAPQQQLPPPRPPAIEEEEVPYYLRQKPVKRMMQEDEEEKMRY
jgi:hypothetical protein